MTVEEKVKELKLYKINVPILYKIIIKDFKDIIKGHDPDNIKQEHYPDKDIHFFIDVLVALDEYNI